MRIAVVLAAAVLIAGAAAGVARADGDPASDYLISQKVFFPYDAKIPASAQRELLATVQSANAQGFKIRVALIWTDYDLGAVTSLWKQPQRYARFLGVELSYYFKGRLLIVMPNGFGFNWPKHDTAAAYRTLGAIPVGNTPEAFVGAATTAVQRLAAQAGVTASAAGANRGGKALGRNGHDRVVILAAVLVALALGALARFVVRRRVSRAP
jgi:hypothetical protein